MSGHDLTDKEKETIRRAVLVRRRLYETNQLESWHTPTIEELAAMYDPEKDDVHSCYEGHCHGSTF